MWQATIARTERTLYSLNVVVMYSNGTQEFDETIVVADPTDQNWLQNKINERLISLVNFDTLEATIHDTALGVITTIDANTLAVSTQPTPQPEPVVLVDSLIGG